MPILAGLLAPDQSSSSLRRLLAGLGLVAAVLALSVVADPLTLLLLGLATVGLTGYALFATDRTALLRFGVVNGLAILLLAWAATERSDILIQRTPEQLEVTVNGVRLAATTAGIESPLNRVTVEQSAMEERPAAAPWVFSSLPWLEGFGDWLVGGMRGGISTLRVVDANDSNLVPPVDGLWQPDHVDGPPRLSGSADAWQVTRAADRAVALMSPEIFNNRYQVLASTMRPSGAVILTFGSEQPGTVLQVIVAPDRRLFAVVAQPRDGPADTLVGGPFVYRRSVVGWLQTLLRELGRVWLVALGLVAAARFLAIPVRASLPVMPAVVSGVLVGVSALLLGLTALALTGLIAVALLDGIPHTVESIAYLFQAEVIALGGLWAPAPILPEFFDQAYVAATLDGRWFGVLPPGQSLLLAAGLALGAPWLVSPLATGLAVGLTVLLGRVTHGALVGVLAGLLLLFSPFVLLLSGEMLAHPTALLLTVLMTLGVVAAIRGTARAWLVSAGWLLAGLAMGGLVLTRPLAGVGIGIPLMIVLVWTGRGVPLKLVVIRAALFVLAAAPGVFYAAHVNAALTGSAFLPPLSLWSDVDRIGFGPNVGTRGGHDLANGLGNVWANTAVLLRHLFGWPSYLTLALAVVPFVLASTSRWDRLYLVGAVGLAVAHLLYWSDGIVYGPRFTFEAVAALALLTARGATLLARGDGTVPTESSESAPSTSSVQPGLSSAPLAVTLLAALLAVNVAGYLPQLILAYQDYNGVSRANLDIVAQAGLEQAVVFVTSDWPDWQSYGTVFPANSPFLDRGVIFARDLGEIENWRLMTRYAEHRWWLLRDGQLTELRR